MSDSAKHEIYGPFEVMERLGVGGMATVHRALERGIEGFERVVALKRLLPHLAEDEAFVRAFVREAKLASLLAHGNIVQLYELGRVGASYFISMEYIRGRDLRQLLRRAKKVTGPPPVPVTVCILSELLDALDYAHQRCDDDGLPLGIVHRDISPSNLLISHTGHLKVIDFGIATATLGRLSSDSGRIKGKLSYMAPEALSSGVLDGRSDLFSASIIAHELLTATPLFAARNDMATIERVQRMAAPAPSLKNPLCPPELDRLVQRGLAKDPSERWTSAAEMRAALAEVTLQNRLHSSNREVAAWVGQAFEGDVARPPVQVLGPSPTRPETGEAAGITAELEEVTDVVWAPHGADAVPVIIDGIPDVSSRFPTLAPLTDFGDDPGASEPRVTFRTPRPTEPYRRSSLSVPVELSDIPSGGLTMVAVPTPHPNARRVQMNDEIVHLPETPRRPPRQKPITAPGEWASGTSPEEEQPPRNDLDRLPLKAPPERRLARASTPNIYFEPDIPLGASIVERHHAPRTGLWLVLAIALGMAAGAVAWILFG